MRARYVALALAGLSAAALAFTSGTYAFPAAMVLLAAAGVPGRVRLRLGSTRNLIFSLALAAAFAAKWRYDPLDSPRAIGGVFFPLAHATGQYFLALLVAQFYVHAETPLPSALPLMAGMVMLCAGNVVLSDAETAAYFVLAVAYVALTGAYFSAARRWAPGRGYGRSVLAVGVLAVVTVLCAVGSRYAYDYHKALSEAFRYVTGFSIRLGPGFSLSARLHGMTSLRRARDADETALRVLAEEAPGYMRGAAYESYSGAEWRLAEPRRSVWPADPPPEGLAEPPYTYRTFVLDDAPGGPWTPFEVRPDNALGEAAMLPHGATVLAAPLNELTADPHGTVTARELAGGTAYVAYTPHRPAPRPPDDERLEALTAVPAELEAAARPLAERIFPRCRTPVEKISAVETYLRESASYGLDFQVPTGREPLEYFLTDRPPAHCEMFASAAVVLLRAGGVPARYVTGFVVQERSRYGDYWLARYRDAHAWAEAYDADRGWVIVEATPPDGVPAPAQPGRWDHLLDYVRFRLQEFRLRIVQQGLKGFALWLLDRVEGLALWLWEATAGRIVLAALGALLLWRLARKLPRRRRPRAEPVPPAVAAMRRVLARMDRRLARRGQARRADETLHQFARRLAGEPAGAAAAEWYLRYARLRYGEEADEADAESLGEAMPP